MQLHFLRTQVIIPEDEQVNLEYVPTKDMAADGLTKALVGEKYSYFICMLGMETRPSGSVEVI